MGATGGRNDRKDDSPPENGHTSAGTGTPPGDDASSPYSIRDPQQMAMNIARALENLGKAATLWLEPRERGERPGETGPMDEMLRTFSVIGNYWTEEPKRLLDAQTSLMGAWFDIWQKSVARAAAQPEQADAPDEGKPRRDRRFADDGWYDNPFYDMLRQGWQSTSGWAERMVAETAGLDEPTRQRASFYVRQVCDALSPANFVFTNPQVWRETVSRNGENLVRGMQMFAEDVAAGGGDLRLRQTDTGSFTPGVNLATTPGKVVARNDLCEIIQYAPVSETVFKRPLVIVPPWINKYYILDLNEKKSFIAWCVQQGHTVFVISWVNPDARHAKKDWQAYIAEGVDFALDTAQQATGETEFNALGYCVGGTLLTAALALHAKKGDRRIRSATLLATQIDFTHAGDLKVFVDERQIALIEEQMRQSGFFDGTRMAIAFNMLRASELIWPYFVNGYLRGQEPPPFDILYWNSDSTRMAEANHSFYLRNCYLDNALAEGRMRIGDTVIDPGDIDVPVYHLATLEDHIAPAKSVFTGSRMTGGETTFVAGGSGHIAGVINPPSSGKYRYLTNEDGVETFEEWLEGAQETPGSWWPHWHAWIAAQDASEVAARIPREDALADAPGTYVLEK